MHESLPGACFHLRIKITQGSVGLLTTSHNLIKKKRGLLNQPHNLLK